MPRSRTRSEFKKKLRGVNVPHWSFDLDGDGEVSHDDYKISKALDALGTGQLSPVQRTRGRKTLASQFFRNHQRDAHLYGSQWTARPGSAAAEENAERLATNPSFNYSLCKLNMKEKRLINHGSYDMTVCMSDAVPEAPPGAGHARDVPEFKGSAAFHSFLLMFGRATSSRSGLEAFSLERARAEHARRSVVESLSSRRRRRRRTSTRTRTAAPARRCSRSGPSPRAPWPRATSTSRRRSAPSSARSASRSSRTGPSRTARRARSRRRGSAATARNSRAFRARRGPAPRAGRLPGAEPDRRAFPSRAPAPARPRRRDPPPTPSIARTHTIHRTARAARPPGAGGGARRPPPT